SLTSLPTSSIVVSPATPSKLIITQQPSATATAGQAFGTQPVIYEEDQYGNLETGDNSKVVTAALNSGAGPLQGTVTATVVGGVATFAGLADDKAESLTLQFTSGSLTPATSSAVTVAPAAATQLIVVTQPPGNVVAGIGFGLVVEAEDPFGNIATG